MSLREDLVGLISDPNAFAGRIAKEIQENEADLVRTPTWRKFTKTFADLAAASTTNSSTIITLPANSVIHTTTMKHSEQFSGGAISAYNLSINGGNLGGTLNGFLAVNDDNFASLGGFSDPDSHPFGGGGSQSLTLSLDATSVGANLDQATQGSVDIWLLLSVLP